VGAKVQRFKGSRLKRISHDGKMKRAYVPLILTAIIVLILLVHVNYLRFVCDDAFISFRYAKNFVEGNGLVYNISERVEGYTNFLWTLLLSLFMKMGLDPVMMSQVLGVLFSLATVLLLLRLNKRFYPEENLFNYLAPLFLACCGAYAAWSTGGLETSLFTFLVLLGSFFFISGIDQPKRFASSGIVFALVCMTRLDGLVLVFVTFAWLLYLLVIKKRVEAKSLALWTLSFLIPFLLYFAWRWSYYGKIFPNTFYIKVTGADYYRQGFSYLLSFVERFWIWFMVIPLFFLGKGMKLNAKLRMVVLYFTSMILVFSCYVVYVGGDFMDMFRFFVPILPFFFFLIQEGFRGMHQYSELLAAGRRKTAFDALSLLLIGSSIFLLAYPSGESNKVWSREGVDSIGLLRESSRLWSKVGLTFKELADPDETLSTTAAGAIAYYSQLYTIDELGLTLASQSGLNVGEYPRVGHQKRVTRKFLVSRKPNYILRHPLFFYDHELDRLRTSQKEEIYFTNGYELALLGIETTEKGRKYLHCFRLKESRAGQIDEDGPLKQNTK
jgi:arabinofuranosyltransferase